MTKPDPIRFDRRVLEEIDQPTLTRGFSYYRQGRVSDIQVEPDGMGLLAAVQGSEPDPYEVDITITKGRRGYGLEGFCTCPVAYNCKHVAAALQAVLTAPAPRPAAPPSGPQSASPVLIPPTSEAALTSWLAGLGPAADSGVPADEAETPDHVRYLLLSPPFDHQPAGLDPVITRPRRDGSGYSQGRRLTLNGLAQSTAKGVTPQDRMLARLILAASGAGYMAGNALPQEPELLADLLDRLLASQRLHWQSLEGPPLRRGPPRRCLIGWPAGAHPACPGRGGGHTRQDGPAPGPGGPCALVCRSRRGPVRPARTAGLAAAGPGPAARPAAGPGGGQPGGAASAFPGPAGAGRRAASAGHHGAGGDG